MLQLDAGTATDKSSQLLRCGTLAPTQPSAPFAEPGYVYSERKRTRLSWESHHCFPCTRIRTQHSR